MTGRSTDRAASCCSGKWHIGAKKAFELFPGGLKKRTLKERRKVWDREHHGVVAAVTEGLATNNLGGVRSEKGASPEDAQQYKLLKGDWEARLELLEGINEKLEDQGERCSRPPRCSSLCP